MKKSKSLNPCKDDKKVKSPLHDIGISIQQVNHLLHELRNQTILTWNYKGIKSLPASLIQEASHVKQLFLKRNLIVKLPNNLGCFRSLTFLYLHGNSIEELPDSIGDIQTLSILDVSNNKLKYLTRSVASLSNLHSLLVANNELCCIPSEISNLKRLSLLFLSGNQLQSLPLSLGKLKSLQGLHIDNNLLKVVPHSLASLPLLAHLSCCNNYLVNLPSKPFISQPILFFDSNQELNYLPFSLLKDLKIGNYFDPFIVPYFGCFVTNPIQNRRVKVCYKEISLNDSILNLPCDLRKVTVYQGAHKLGVPSLLELCLRYLWNQKKQSQFGHILEPGILPSSLTNCLDIGPVIFCESCQNAIIFTYTSFLVIGVEITSQTGNKGHEIPVVIYFCSDTCGFTFMQSINYLPDSYNIFLHKCLSNPLTVVMVESSS